MKSPIIFIISILFFISACSVEEQVLVVSDCASNLPSAPDHSLKAPLQAIMDKYVKRGLPGAVIGIKDQEGYWVGTAGFAQLETQTRMEPCQVHLGYSVTKTFTATAVMRLVEQGKMELDRTIQTYLPDKIANNIPGRDKITVRQLLNHTSGLPDFFDMLSWQSDWLSNPSKIRTKEANLETIYNKSLRFEPGTDWQYSNTNYLLLAFIIEHVTKQNHAQVLKELVLDRANLNIYYKIQPAYLEELPLPNFYSDRFANGNLENITRAHVNTYGYSDNGSGGIAAAPADFMFFLDALRKGLIVSGTSLQQMQQWVKGKHSADWEYGLGFEYYQYGGGQAELGHGGTGIGGRTLLLHSPDNDITFFIATNLGGETSVQQIILTSEFLNETAEFLCKPR